MDNLSIQVVDLPPLAEGGVDGLPYGDKLRPIMGLADVVCVVLDASDDVESQELVLSEELDSLGVRPQTASVLLDNRAPENADSDDVTPSGPITGTRVHLRSRRDFDDVLPHVVGAGGYILTLAKPPGQPAEEAGRLWVKRGATVDDLATTVHRDLARRLTGARVWGDSARQPGQTVSAEHALTDGDMVELLTRCPTKCSDGECRTPRPSPVADLAVT